MRALLAYPCLLTLLFLVGIGRTAGAAPAIPSREVLPPALEETARLLERYGELEHAALLAFHPLVQPDDADSSSTRLLRLRSRLLVKQSRFQHADSILSIIPSASDRDEDVLRVLTRARINYLDERYERARELVSSIDSVPSVLFNDYRAMIRMQVLSSLGRTADAADAGDRVWRRGVPAPLSPEFEKSLLEALEAEERYQPALRVIEKLRRRYGDDEITFPFISREMQIYLARGDSAQIFELALKIADHHAARPIALEFSRIALSVFPHTWMATDTLLTFCSVLLNHGDTDNAAELLDEVQERRCGEYDREHARYLRARLLFLRRQYTTALALLESPFGDPQLAKHALLLTARTYRRLKQYRQSAQTYVQYGKAYPGARLAREALFVASNLYERLGHQIEADRVRTYIATTYPRYYHGRISALRLAWQKMDARDYAGSIAILERALKKSRGAPEDILYYLARSFYQNGNEERYRKTVERLRANDPFSFYLLPDISGDYRMPELTSRGRIRFAGNNSLLELLQRFHERQIEAYERIRPSVHAASEDRNDWQNNENLRRGSMFLDAGLVEWGIQELDVAYDELKSNPSALFEMGCLFEKHALAWHSVRMFTRLRYLLRADRELISSGAFEVLLYPIPFPGTVLEQCILLHIPPHFAFAMIREESRFDARAVSRAGALGLMQIMPETGREIARDLGYPMRSAGILLQPEINIAFGMSYAARLLDRCDGNYYMMLGAYNAGMGNAARWFTPEKAKLSIQKQVDGIDYKETRSYVQRIVESSRHYAAFFAREASL